MFGIDVGTILNEFIASITGLCRGLLPGRYLDSIFGKYESSADERGGNMVTKHPQAHPLHMNVVTHLTYTWHWSEKYFKWVYNFNHHTMLQFAPQEYSRIQARFQKFDQ